jgi:hypothetical protein
MYIWFWIGDAEHNGIATIVLDQCVPRSTDCTLASIGNVKVRTGLRRSCVELLLQFVAIQIF